MWGATSPPTGWLLCDGSAVSRTTYSALFGVISTGWGVGDGSTTFNLPDLRGRFPVGVGTHTDVNALGKNEGAVIGDRRPKHKHTVVLSDPGHNHTVTDSGHSHSTTVQNSGATAPTFAGGGGSNQASAQTGTSLTGITIASKITGISVTVGEQSNASLDTGAFLAVPFIIKT